MDIAMFVGIYLIVVGMAVAFALIDAWIEGSFRDD